MKIICELVDVKDDKITLKMLDYPSKIQAKELKNGNSYRLNVNEIKSKRTLEQNALLWQLIHEIAIARSGVRANDDEDIYYEALERAGAKYEYVACLPSAEKVLLKHFRAIKKLNSFTHKGKIFNQYKAFYGSSTMDKKEMSILLDTVLDMATEEGIETEAVI